MRPGLRLKNYLSNKSGGKFSVIKSMISVLIQFLLCFLFFFSLASEAHFSSPIVRIKILEGEKSINAGATGSYYLEDGGESHFYVSSQTIEVTSSGIKVGNVIRGKRIWIRPEGDDSLSLLNGKRYRGDLIIQQEEISEKLENLPPEVKFPVHLRDRISYDKSQKLLIFKGVMSEKEKKELLALSENEPYKKAIEAIFQKSQEGDFLEVINELPLEEYLYGVIEEEMPSSWPSHALYAQAVVARTYALERIERMERLGKDQDYDLSSTTDDQLYGGVESETSRARQAVDETRGKVIIYEGELIEAIYHNCCGGYTTSSGDVWGGEDYPYLRVGPDEFCKESPYYTWEERIKVSDLEEVLREKGVVGKIYRLEVLSRDQNLSFEEGGRVAELRIYYAGGDKDITGRQFRDWVNKWAGENLIKSRLFKVKRQPEGEESYFYFEGRGSGHGVGMCQWGAKGMAEEGHSFEEILQFYYPGTKIEKLY